MDRLLTPEDVMDRLRVSQQSARAIMKQLKHVRVGRLLRVSESVLEEWIAQGGNVAEYEPERVPQHVVLAQLNERIREQKARSPLSDQIKARIGSYKSSSGTRVEINSRGARVARVWETPEHLKKKPRTRPTWSERMTLEAEASREAVAKPVEPTVPSEHVEFTVRTPLEAERACEVKRARRRNRM